MSLHTLVLAAGRGSRFGDEPKQLALVAGKTLLERSVTLAKNVGETTVVLGYEHARLNSLVKDARVVVNPDWREGLGSSIARGVAALPANTSAVLILLCDQVALAAADLDALILCYQETFSSADSAAIVCAGYADGPGVPAIFPRRYFAQLMELDGDAGAKIILRTNPVLRIPMEHAQIDVDTPQDLASFIADRSTKQKPDNPF